MSFTFLKGFTNGPCIVFQGIWSVFAKILQKLEIYTLGSMHTNINVLVSFYFSHNFFYSPNDLQMALIIFPRIFKVFFNKSPKTLKFAHLMLRYRNQKKLWVFISLHCLLMSSNGVQMALTMLLKTFIVFFKLLQNLESFTLGAKGENIKKIVPFFFLSQRLLVFQNGVQMALLGLSKYL